MTFLAYLITTVIMSYLVPALTFYDLHWFLDLAEWRPEDRGFLAVYLVLSQLCAALMACVAQCWTWTKGDGQ